MINALHSFLVLHPNDFDKREIFTIKKVIHADKNGEIHFNFSYRGKTYHAYVADTIVMFNGRPQIVGLTIWKITVLSMIF
jgi:hypothetical protein